MLRYLTAGESHGRALTVIVEGLPAGVPILASDIESELARRRLGYGRGPRQRFEEDRVTLVGGVRHGRTLGSPVCIEIQNSEWFRSDKWHAEMSPEPGHTEVPLTQPRPGHADLVGMQKYGFSDARDVLERACARETAARVAAGALADQSKLPEAVAMFDSVLSVPKRVQDYHLRQWYMAADLHDRSGNVVEARRLFARVMQYDPDFVDVSERLDHIGPPRR